MPETPGGGGGVRPRGGPPAARLRQHAGKRSDERRLAGAVRADDGDDRAFFDVERNRVERLHVAVEHIEVFDAQHHVSAFQRIWRVTSPRELW